MRDIRFSKRNLLAFVAGFFTIVLIGGITSTLSFLMMTNISRVFSPPYATFNWLLRGLSFLSPVIGGLVVGWMVKEKGWLYGGILGFTLKLISIGVVSLTFFLPSPLVFGSKFPSNYGQKLAQKNIFNQLLDLPVTIALTVLGGYWGERLRIKNRK